MRSKLDKLASMLRVMLGSFALIILKSRIVAGSLGRYCHLRCCPVHLAFGPLQLQQYGSHWITSGGGMEMLREWCVAAVDAADRCDGDEELVLKWTSSPLTRPVHTKATRKSIRGRCILGVSVDAGFQSAKKYICSSNLKPFFVNKHMKHVLNFHWKLCDFQKESHYHRTWLL